MLLTLTKQEWHMWEHKQREADTFSSSLGGHTHTHTATDDICVGQLNQFIQFILCSARWDFALHQSLFFSSTPLLSENPPKNDLDSPHSPACWSLIHSKGFFCRPLIMISRTWVRSIILVSISMMSGWSWDPLINSSSVSSPEDTRSKRWSKGFMTSRLFFDAYMDEKGLGRSWWYYF